MLVQFFATTLTIDYTIIQLIDDRLFTFHSDWDHMMQGSDYVH